MDHSENDKYIIVPSGFNIYFRRRQNIVLCYQILLFITINPKNDVFSVLFYKTGAL